MVTKRQRKRAAGDPKFQDFKALPADVQRRVVSQVSLKNAARLTMAGRVGRDAAAEYVAAEKLRQRTAVVKARAAAIRAAAQRLAPLIAFGLMGFRRPGAVFKAPWVLNTVRRWAKATIHLNDQPQTAVTLSMEAPLGDLSALGSGLFIEIETRPPGAKYRYLEMLARVDMVPTETQAGAFAMKVYMFPETAVKVVQVLKALRAAMGMARRIVDATARGLGWPPVKYEIEERIEGFWA